LFPGTTDCDSAGLAVGLARKTTCIVFFTMSASVGCQQVWAVSTFVLNKAAKQMRPMTPRVNLFSTPGLLKPGTKAQQNKDPASRSLTWCYGATVKRCYAVTTCKGVQLSTAEQCCYSFCRTPIAHVHINYSSLLTTTCL